MQLSFCKYPFSLFFLSLITGFFLSQHIIFSVKTLGFIVGAIVCLLLLLYNQRMVFSYVAISLWFFIGLWIGNLANAKPNNELSKQINNYSLYSMRVKVLDRLKSNDKSYKYLIKVLEIQDIEESEKSVLFIDKNREENINIGSEYSVKARLSIINKKNIAVYNYYARQGIYTYTNLVEINKTEGNNSNLYNIVRDFNFKCSQKIDSLNIRAYSKDFLKAVVLGDRYTMQEEETQIYSKSGVIHIMAISGLHITMIFGLLYSVLVFMNKKWRVLSSLMIIWIFVIFVSMPSSAVRASIMLSCFVLANLLKREHNKYEVLSISAIAILLYSPNELYTVGFQLSYVAVFFIFWLSPLLQSMLKQRNQKIEKYIVVPFSVTISAQIGVLPLLIYYFHQFSVLSFIANFLLIFYSFILVTASFIEILFGVLLEIYWINNVYDRVVGIFHYSIKNIADQDFFIIKDMSLSLPKLLFSYLLLIVIGFYSNKSRCKFLFMLCAVVLLLQIYRLLERIFFI